MIKCSAKISLLFLLFFSSNLFGQERFQSLFKKVSISEIETDSIRNILRSLKTSQVLQLNSATNPVFSSASSNLNITFPTKLQGDIDVNLEAVEILTDDIRINSDKGEVKVDLPKFYRGSIVGKKKSFVAITVTKDSFEGMIVCDDYNYTIGSIKNFKTKQIVIYSTKELPASKVFEEFEPKELKKIESDFSETQRIISKAEYEKKSITTSVGTVRIDLEIAYQAYVDWGYNETLVINQITTIFNNVAQLYANENITLLLSSIYLWTSPDPYSDALWIGDALNLFQQKPPTTGDLAHLVTTKNLGGGIAYIAFGTPVYGNMTERAVFANCIDQSLVYGVSANLENNQIGLPTYSWNVNVIAHEIGHNFGIPHTQSCNWPGGPLDNCWQPEGTCTNGPTPTNGGTIMSYCHVTSVGINFLNGFGQMPGDKMRAEVVAASCLSNTCSSVDWNVLRNFYQLMNGDNWTNKTGWEIIKNNPIPPSNCTFSGIYGITSSLIGGRERVTKILLPNNGLSGNLIPIVSSWLKLLVQLTEVNISNNQIGGNIPSELGSLSKLTKLSLNNNQFMGEIPQELGNLQLLTHLYLNNNQLTGCFKSNLKQLCSRLTSYDINTGNSGLIAQWVNFCNNNDGTCNVNISVNDYNVLRDFYLSTNGDSWTNKTGWDVVKNNITPPPGFSFSSLFGIRNALINNEERVTEILMTYNSVSGSMPSTIGNLNYLERIVVYINQLGGTIPTSFGNLTNLKYVNLGFNSITGQLPDLSGLTDLRSLFLYKNRISGTIPNSITTLNQLVEINLGYNELTGTLPTTIGNLPNLLSLTLDHNQLSGTIPTSIGNLTNLTTLVLQNNQLTGSIPTQIGNLLRLKKLYLDYNQLTGTIPLVIFNLIKLEYLQLNNNQLTGTLPASLSNLANLYWFFASFNQLTGTIPTGITALSKIQQIYLNNNQFTGTIPANIGDLTFLRELTLGANQLSGTIPSSITNLLNLSALTLNSNQLSGSLPTGFENLTLLRMLFLNNNQLTGSLPTSIGNLINMETLVLYDNKFSGAIPPSMGNLSKLTGLYIQNNQFTGSIPSSIGGLANLIALYLFDNQLSGTIPGSLGNLSKLLYISIYNNSLSGCYSSNLKKICSTYGSVSEGNSGLLASWSNFCSNNAGMCLCEDIINLQSPANDFNSVTQIIESSQLMGQINATNKISGSSNITFKAGKQITLSPGFSVENGSVFKTEQGGCN